MKIDNVHGNSEMPSATGPSAKENEELRKVARSFESLFVNQIVGAMRKTVTKGGLFPESQAEKVYQGMLDTEYAQKISDTEQLGLSKLVYDHLMRQLGQR